MIDNLFDVLYVAKTGKIKPDASLTDNLYGKKFYDAHSGVITTATGNPVSIVTNKAQNAISTLLSYSPKQTGSGDPSPQNIRPIEGWTEANLTGAGKNLFSFGDQSFTREKRLYLVYPLRAGTYSISAVITTTDTDYSTCRISFVDSNNSTIDYEDMARNTRSSKTFVLDRPCYAIYLFAGRTSSSSAGDDAEWKDIQIEVGSQATDYAPFITPTTTTANLGGTYYGFSIDVERGVLTVPHAIAVFDGTEGINYSEYQGHGRFSATVLTGAKSGTNVPLACSHYKPSTAPVYANNANNTVCAYGTNLFLRDDSITTKEDMQTYLATQYANGTPVCAVYELAEPLELPLTPQTVALLAGNNTLWCDGDSLSVTYKAKK